MRSWSEDPSQILAVGNGRHSGGSHLRIARAQAYPVRPISMIVPFPAGGPTDTIGRVVAEGTGASSLSETRLRCGGSKFQRRCLVDSPAAPDALLAHGVSPDVA
jgi:hypothetical protein